MSISRDLRTVPGSTTTFRGTRLDHRTCPPTQRSTASRSDDALARATLAMRDACLRACVDTVCSARIRDPLLLVLFVTALWSCATSPLSPAPANDPRAWPGYASSSPAPIATTGGAAPCPEEMVWIPASSGQALTAPFCLDVVEVTVAAYAQCVQRGGCSMPSNSDAACNFGQPNRWNHPINCVNAAQAAAYCAAVGKRLPSMQEYIVAEGPKPPWTTRRPLPRGRCWTAPPASDRGEAKSQGTCAVGTDPPTAYGLRDVFGNVWEWTSTRGSPSAPLFLLGGATSDDNGSIYPCDFARSADANDSDIGLRCAR